MYKINVGTVDYQDPWESTFEEQLVALSRSAYHIAYYCDQPNNSTFRYRVYNMMQTLQEANLPVGTGYFCYDDLPHFADVLQLADVLVINRSKYTHKLAHRIVQAQAKQIPVLYDIDDYVFDVTQTHLVTCTLDQLSDDRSLWDFWFADLGRIGATLKLCDAAITTNDFLARKVRAFTGKPAYIIPNFLNKEQLAISRRIYQQKTESQFARTGHLHIGYFSGTPSHNQDFTIVGDALAAILEENPHVRLRIVGYLGQQTVLSNYSSQIEYVPFTDFINLQRFIGETEINIVPLQYNEFTNCKSQLKYFEAAITGTITVASPVFTYAQSIEDGHNGYLVRSHQWYDRLSSLVTDFDNQRSVIRAGHQHSLDYFSGTNQIPRLTAILNINSTG